MSHRSGFTVTRDDGGGSADNINYEVVYKSFTPSFQSDTIIPTFGNLHRGGGAWPNRQSLLENRQDKQKKIVSSSDNGLYLVIASEVYFCPSWYHPHQGCPGKWPLNKFVCHLYDAI